MAIPFDPDDDDGFEFVDEESDFGGAESEFPGAESDFGDDESAMVCGCFFQFLCQRKLSMKNASSTYQGSIFIMIHIKGSVIGAVVVKQEA
ncbi:hypothetical protein P8452_43019 [Trifolium repens]|nr:hypothetical protein P8452_43019 [Trifolium repens]